jgi:hypothetical protein
MNCWNSLIGGYTPSSWNFLKSSSVTKSESMPVIKYIVLLTCAIKNLMRVWDFIPEKKYMIGADLDLKKVAHKVSYSRRSFVLDVKNFPLCFMTNTLTNPLGVMFGFTLTVAELLRDTLKLQLSHSESRIDQLDNNTLPPVNGRTVSIVDYMGRLVGILPQNIQTNMPLSILGTMYGNGVKSDCLL